MVCLCDASAMLFQEKWGSLKRETGLLCDVLARYDSSVTWVNRLNFFCKNLMKQIPAEVQKYLPTIYFGQQAPYNSTLSVGAERRARQALGVMSVSKAEI
jgi:hypothetical protein